VWRRASVDDASSTIMFMTDGGEICSQESGAWQGRAGSAARAPGGGRWSQA